MIWHIKPRKWQWCWNIFERKVTFWIDILKWLPWTAILLKDMQVSLAHIGGPDCSETWDPFGCVQSLSMPDSFVMSLNFAASDCCAEANGTMLRLMVYAATEGHEWVRGSTTAKDHAVVCDAVVWPPNLMRILWSGMMTEAMLNSVDTGKLALLFSVHSTVVCWVWESLSNASPATTQLSSFHAFCHECRQRNTHPLLEAWPLGI